MGFGLPAAVGAKKARPHDEVILVTGDGSLMMNIQELGSITVSYTHLLMKLALRYIKSIYRNNKKGRAEHALLISKCGQF